MPIQRCELGCLDGDEFVNDTVVDALSHAAVELSCEFSSIRTLPRCGVFNSVQIAAITKDFFQKKAETEDHHSLRDRIVEDIFAHFERDEKVFIQVFIIVSLS